LKIAEYRVTPIAFGDPPLRAASGLHAPYALRTIVEVVSDDGISGVGETHGGAAALADLEAVRDLVIGRDPFQLAALEQAIWPSAGSRSESGGIERAVSGLQWPPRTFGAIEVACL